MELPLLRQKIMKHKYSILSSFLAVALSLTACDEIAEDERVIINIEEPNAIAPSIMVAEVEGEFFEFTDEHHSLVADFTGWKCVNCPMIADFLTANIIPNFNSVLVSLHMTTNSFSAGHLNKYNCASADSIANWIYGEDVASQLALPSVAIDNCEYQGKRLLSNTNDIETLARDRYLDCNFYHNTPVAHIATNVNKQEDGVYNISTLVYYPSAKSYTIRLWLIEEELISLLQSSSTGTIKNYKNHGILRQVINGSYEGQTITINNDEPGLLHTKLDISGKNYKAENCYVVAFVTDVNSREVLDCVRVAIEQ